MTPPSPEIQDFLKDLTRSSLKGDVNWVALSDFGFATEAKSGRAVIYSIDEDGSAPYEFYVQDGNGVRIEAIESGPVGNVNRQLEDLYLSARRHALKTDKIFNALRDELGIKSDDIPF